MNMEWLDKRKALRNARKESRPLSNRAQVVQAGITGGTLFLASLAFLSWTGQEIAKRRADVAIDLMRSSIVATRCFAEGLRPGPLPSTSNRKEEIKQARAGIERMEKCASALAKLEADAELAESVLDADASRAGTILHNSIRQNIGSYSMIIAILGDSEQEVVIYQESIEEVTYLWKWLGNPRVKPGESVCCGTSGPDGAEADVLEKNRDLQKRLIEYIRFEQQGILRNVFFVKGPRPRQGRSE
jgi:hypothetical protein